MKDERWLEPVDPGSTTMLDLLVEAVRAAVPPVVDTQSLTMARFAGDFPQAVLALELELAAQRISVLHRHCLSDLLAYDGLPVGLRAIVFDVWSADAAAALLARDAAHAVHLPWRIAVVERGEDVLLLMPRQQPASVHPFAGAAAGERWTDRLRQCIENAVRCASCRSGDG